MAPYNLEIIQSPSHPKALKRIAALCRVKENEVQAKLQLAPLIAGKSLPLSEAVEIERELKRLGVRTNLVKVEEDETTPTDAEVLTIEEIEEIPPIEDEEVIEIPEDEVKVLTPQEMNASVSTFKRRAVRRRGWWLGGSALALFVIAVILASWYAVATSNKRQMVTEINLYIDQWVNTLRQQDLLLDKGFPPERIFYKLDDLERKIQSLLTGFHSLDEANEYRTRFHAVQRENRSLVRDLAFRRSLEESGYPVHPTCIVDRGMVRGSSELPESTLLRIQLLGEDDLETVYYAARLTGGTFKLIIDPTIERKIYDARATVASFSQQPKEIQRWAERKFNLEEFCDNYLPRPARRSGSQKTALETAATAASSANVNTTGKQPSISVPWSDPGSDKARAEELQVALDRWTGTMVEAESQPLEVNDSILESIYLRLLELEVRIDQLIELMESPQNRNLWTQRREDVFGSYIAERMRIESLYESKISTDNPFKMESALRRKLRETGFPGAEVLVVDSPEMPGAFVMEIEIYRGKKEDILVAVAKEVSEALGRSSLRVDRVRLRISGETLRWTTDQIRSAAEELKSPGGRRRCIAKMELTAVSYSTP